MKGKLSREEAQARSEAKRAQADALITGALDQLTDPAMWAEYLARGESLGRYSIRNQLLIGMQCPEASDVAGYVEWQDRGRQVRRGETGILIFAPVTRKAPVEGGLVLKRDAEPGDETVTQMRGIRVTSVFDIGQTDPIEGRPFRAAKSAGARDPDEIRAVIEAIAGDHAGAILDALDQAAELVAA